MPTSCFIYSYYVLCLQLFFYSLDGYIDPNTDLFFDQANYFNSYSAPSFHPQDYLKYNKRDPPIELNHPPFSTSHYANRNDATHPLPPVTVWEIHHSHHKDKLSTGYLLLRRDDTVQRITVDQQTGVKIDSQCIVSPDDRIDAPRLKHLIKPQKYADDNKYDTVIDVKKCPLIDILFQYVSGFSTRLLIQPNGRVYSFGLIKTETLGNGQRLKWENFIIQFFQEPLSLLISYRQPVHLIIEGLTGKKLVFNKVAQCESVICYGQKITDGTQSFWALEAVDSHSPKRHLTSSQFKNIGIWMGKQISDQSQSSISNNPIFLFTPGKFKPEGIERSTSSVQIHLHEGTVNHLSHDSLHSHTELTESDLLLRDISQLIDTAEIISFDLETIPWLGQFESDNPNLNIKGALFRMMYYEPKDIIQTTYSLETNPLEQTSQLDSMNYHPTEMLF